MTDQELINLLKTNPIEGLKILDDRAIKKGFEIWKTIKNYPNYKVSSKGRVKNVKYDRIIKPSDNGRGYQCLNLLKNGKSKKSFKIHRLVGITFLINSENKKQIDHIDNNRQNNNVNNLRWVTNQENQFNASLSKNNTSGHKGVTFVKKTKLWRARITFNNKLISLGCFDKIADAIKARQIKSIELFGQYKNKCET